MDIFWAVILGVLQGVTEFLPVSSSGHLILAEHFFGLSETPLSFDVSLHMGTLVAVLLYFRHDWLAMVRALLPGEDRRKLHTLLLVFVGTVPAALAGVFLEDYVSSVLRSPWVVVSTLVVVGLLIALAEKVSRQERGLEASSWRDGLVIGLAQALALVPGVSRSGITISAGLFMGLNRTAAARFSFLLSAPIIAGAGLLEGIKAVSGGDSVIGAAAYVAGFCSSLATGYGVIAFFMDFLRTHTLYPFVVYRLALASVVAAILLNGGF